VEVALLVGVVAAVGGLIVGLGKLATRQAQKIDQLWIETAGLLGGTYTPSDGAILQARPRTIEADVDGIAVVIDHFTVSTGKSSAVFTRLRAWAPGVFALRLTILPSGILRDLTVALGAQDLQLGDPAFDDAYVLKGRDVAMVRAWLDGPARTAAAMAEPRLDLHAEKDEHLRMNWLGIDHPPPHVVRLVRAIAAVAGGGQRLVAAWRAAAAELGGRLVVEDLAALELRGHAGRRDLAIRIRRDQEDLRLHVTLQLARHTAEPLRVALESSLPVTVQPLWARARPRTAVRVEDRVVVVLDDVTADLDRWRAAVALGEALADDAGPAYR
jgi:hypothetical protein